MRKYFLWVLFGTSIYFLFFRRRQTGQLMQSLVGFNPYLDMTIPRGIRNNNPLNIRRTATKWQGEREEVSDKDFEEFTDMSFGIRAALKTLRTYLLNGHDTVRKIVSRWAPSSENDTDAYIRVVMKKMAEVAPDWASNGVDTIVFSKDLAYLAYSMAVVEVGIKYVPKIDLFITVYKKYFV